MSFLSPARTAAIIRKEFIQMRRDRLTFAMMVGVPIMQVVLFGFAINTNPKRLPTLVVNGDLGPIQRSIVVALQNSEFFTIANPHASAAEADAALRRGQAQFVLHFPEDFERRLLRGERPALLMEADGTDPMAVAPSLAALPVLINNSLAIHATGATGTLRPAPPPYDLRVHTRFNPEIESSFNVVPGLMGVILTMTLVMITALAMTRERERGTMENLLSTPVRPTEVLIGKIVPYILVGYIQVGLVLAAARFLFHVPFIGSIPLLLACTLPFILANLGMGITFSTIAKNQLQAVQMAFFFFLPSILLSGFMFPFRGMPSWAQAIGSCLPLTHFLQIVRGIILRGNDFPDIAPRLLPIALFLCASLFLGITRYRQTLD